MMISVEWCRKYIINNDLTVTRKRPSSNINQSDNSNGIDSGIKTCHLATDIEICNRDDYNGVVEI